MSRWSALVKSGKSDVQIDGVPYWLIEDDSGTKMWKTVCFVCGDAIVVIAPRDIKRGLRPSKCEGHKDEPASKRRKARA